MSDARKMLRENRKKPQGPSYKKGEEKTTLGKRGCETPQKGKTTIAKQRRRAIVNLIPKEEGRVIPSTLKEGISTQKERKEKKHYL